MLTVRTEKLVAILRDGRKYIGVLRSWDQFGTFDMRCYAGCEESRNA